MTDQYHKPGRLTIPAELLPVMENRMITPEDVRAVVSVAESTDGKLQNRISAHFLASKRIGAVTFWVEYSLDGGAALVHNAYSHRMEIVEEGL